MKKLWVKSVALAGGIMLLSAPVVALSASAAQESVNPRSDLLQLGSGGIAVPGFEAPKDGIIGGLAGCLPDIHEYFKNEAEEHVVFSASVTSKQMTPKALKTLLERGMLTVYAEVYSDNKKLVELPLEVHPTPDPNTGKDFLVTCLFINDPNTDLPTGSYTYKFKVKTKSSGNKDFSFVLADWVPDNNTFTIVDRSAEAN